jgi:hypothetical protein
MRIAYLLKTLAVNAFGRRSATMVLVASLAAAPGARWQTSRAVYRCWHFNGGGGAGTCRTSTTPLIFNADGTYQESTTRGTYTIKGNTVVMSASKVRGPGHIEGNTIVFKYMMDNLPFTVTYLLQSGTALKARDG